MGCGTATGGDGGSVGCEGEVPGELKREKGTVS